MVNSVANPPSIWLIRVGERARGGREGGEKGQTGVGLRSGAGLHCWMGGNNIDTVCLTHKTQESTLMLNRREALIASAPLLKAAKMVCISPDGDKLSGKIS